VLQGWEVKALREGKAQLTDGYVVIRDGELFLIGCQINPLRRLRPTSSRRPPAPRSC
jgi:SsrA-binding protein